MNDDVYSANLITSYCVQENDVGGEATKGHIHIV